MRALISLNRSNFNVTPASLAIARICRTVLVEQPKAMSTVKALSIDCSLIISRGLIFFSTNSMIFLPVSLATLIRAAETANLVPLPGKATPNASVKQFIELAVNIPEQEPQPGQA